MSAAFMSVAMVLGWGWVIVCFTIGAFRMLPKTGGLLSWWSIGCISWVLHAWAASVHGAAVSGDTAVWMVVLNTLSLGMLVVVAGAAIASESARLRRGSGEPPGGTGITRS